MTELRKAIIPDDVMRVLNSISEENFRVGVSFDNGGPGCFVVHAGRLNLSQAPSVLELDQRIARAYPQFASGILRPAAQLSDAAESLADLKRKITALYQLGM